MNKQVGTLATVLVLAGLAACVKSASADGAVSPTKVLVDEKGFTPSSITIPHGHAAAIEFTRTSDRTCATKIVFPELHVTKDLPLHAPVTVNLPAGEAKTYAFQCGMGMMKGSVVVQ